MRKGQSKDAVVVLNRYTMEQVARYEGVVAAAADLELNASSIRRSIHGHIPVFGCYWVYEQQLPVWMPKLGCFKRAATKTSHKLNALLNKQ